MIRVRLVHTTENQRRPGEFRQKWTIIDHDGTEHTVMTDAEWGDFDQRDDKGLLPRQESFASLGSGFALFSDEIS